MNPQVTIIIWWVLRLFSNASLVQKDKESLRISAISNLKMQLTLNMLKLNILVLNYITKILLVNVKFQTGIKFR